MKHIGFHYIKSESCNGINIDRNGGHEMKKKFSYIVIDMENGGACYALSGINEIKCGLAKDLLGREYSERFKLLEPIMVIYFDNGKFEPFSLAHGETAIYFE